MVLTMFVSTCFFVLLLGLGNVLLFIDPFIYWTIPLYIDLLCITMHSFQATCIVLEKKDFLYKALFTLLVYFLYMQNGIDIDIANLMYVYVATFISFLLFSCSIRFKSLK